MLKHILATLLLVLPLSLAAQTAKPTPAAATSTAAEAHPRVVIHTSQGDITFELFPDKSPKSVANFLQYVRDGFYDGTIFHRAISGYLLQGGLYTRDLQQKRTRAAVASEADNGVSNLRGTVAVARGADANSGTAQFFINLVDNRRLDYVGNQSGLTWGYAVFGKVVGGMDVVEKISNMPTQGQGPFVGDVPNPMVVITSANVVGEEKTAPASSGSAPAKATAPIPAPPAKKPAAKSKAQP
jgi:peptidyl-prolyl cis-trans isomerase A (cyclophilin A)